MTHECVPVLVAELAALRQKLEAAERKAAHHRDNVAASRAIAHACESRALAAEAALAQLVSAVRLCESDGGCRAGWVADMLPAPAAGQAAQFINCPQCGMPADLSKNEVCELCQAAYDRACKPAAPAGKKGE